MPEESTTPDLEEKARQLIEAGNRRDLDAALAVYSEGAVFDRSAVGLEVFEGRQAICAFIEDWWRAYEDYEWQLEEFRDLGNGVTFTVVFQRGQLPGSAGWVQNRFASVMTWVGGLIERHANYADIDQARAAAERLAEERADG